METKLPKEVVLKAVKNCVDVYAHANDFTVDKSIPRILYSNGRGNILNG
jgi:hypothetical protein